MYRFFLGLILGLFISTAFADKISSPPPLDEKLVTVQHYFQEIYQNLHRLEVVTSNPDGTRNGKRGDMLLLQTGGSSYLEINSDSSTTWLGVILTNVP